MPILGALAVGMIVAPIVTAQDAAHPDFSGTWILESAGGDLPERAVKVLTKGASQPITLVIVQSAQALHVTRETDKGPLSAIFPLNGSETIQSTPHGELRSRTPGRAPRSSAPAHARFRDRFRLGRVSWGSPKLERCRKTDGG